MYVLHAQLHSTHLCHSITPWHMSLTGWLATKRTKEKPVPDAFKAPLYRQRRQTSSGLETRWSLNGYIAVANISREGGFIIFRVPQAMIDGGGGGGVGEENRARFTIGFRQLSRTAKCSNADEHFCYCADFPSTMKRTRVANGKRIIIGGGHKMVSSTFIVQVLRMLATGDTCLVRLYYTVVGHQQQQHHHNLSLPPDFEYNVGRLDFFGGPLLVKNYNLVKWQVKDGKRSLVLLLIRRLGVKLSTSHGNGDDL